MKENDMLGTDFVSSVTKMDTCWASAQLRRKEDQKGRTRDAIRGKGRRRSDSHLAVISEQRIWTAVPVTTHGLPHYEYLICQTGMLTFTFLLIVLWLTHTDLPIPLPFALSLSSPFALVTICVPPFAQLLYSLCPLP